MHLPGFRVGLFGRAGRLAALGVVVLTRILIATVASVMAVPPTSMPSDARRVGRRIATAAKTATPTMVLSRPRVGSRRHPARPETRRSIPLCRRPRPLRPRDTRPRRRLGAQQAPPTAATFPMFLVAIGPATTASTFRVVWAPASTTAGWTASTSTNWTSPASTGRGPTTVWVRARGQNIQVCATFDLRHMQARSRQGRETVSGPDGFPWLARGWSALSCWQV